MPGESPKKYLKNGSLSNGERWRITCLDEMFVTAFTVCSAISLKLGKSASRLVGCSTAFGTSGCWEIMPGWIAVVAGCAGDEVASLVEVVRSDPLRMNPAMRPQAKMRNATVINEGRMNIDSS